jgi:hypothetical protein
MVDVRIYTGETIKAMGWPKTPDGDYAERYLIPFFQHGTEAFMRNVHHTSLMVAKVDQNVFPITVTDFHPENSYTVSPYSHYISYGGFEEVERLNNAAAETAIKAVVSPIAWYFRRSQFDQVVYVNNWLLSTNLYPEMDYPVMERLAEVLPDLFPDRAVIFRSVDAHRSPRLHDALKQAGYRMVLSRQVWYMQPEVSIKTTQFKEDMRHFRRSKYEVIDASEITDADLPRIKELYDLLYIQKYSHFNPQFTEAFIRLARDCETLHLKALRCDGRIDAVMGYFVRNGAMTAPLFGYDTRLPKQAALYRLLSVQLIRDALERGLTVHASAGVGPFKKLRGGIPVIEYNAVFDRHLPASRQRPWSFLKAISDKIAIPVFQKYGF